MCSSGDVGIIRKIATQSGYTGSDFDTTGQAIETAITGKGSGDTSVLSTSNVFKPPPILKKASEGFDQFGRRIKTGVSTATEHIKKETGKLAEGDFSLKNAVQGTVSGASETFKKSDTGKIVKKIADQSGYTGSDMDTGLQKIEKETSNVVNQVLDTVDSPGKVMEKVGEKASNFVEGIKEDLTDTANAYGNVIKNIGETGEKIGKIATDTFNTGMNVSSTLGSNLAKQVMKAKADFSSAMGGITGGMGEKTSSRADLLERDRDKRRGGLSRSGTSRTLITGKY